MRILIIRHAEPYYPTDSLTEKGRREAELLSERLAKEHLDSIYVSPLGRAKMTAAPTLRKIGKSAVELEWLKEFPLGLQTPYSTRFSDNETCPWDLPPELWTGIKGIYDPAAWREASMYQGTGIVEEYDRICAQFDQLTAQHGFVRDGGFYRIQPGFENSKETVALFCHMGLGNLLLSHLMNLSLPAVWHALFLPTSSVTTILMEQHLIGTGTANAKIFQIGDTSHLYAGGEPVSPSGLFSDTIY